MNNAVIVSLTTAATLTLGLAVSLTAPPARASEVATASDAAPASVTAPASTPSPAISNGLCNLTPSDVAGIADYYALTPNMTALAAALSTPFDCDAYGGLCTTMPQQQAHMHVCRTWQDMLEQRSIEEINVRAWNRLKLNGTPCPPDWGTCDEICSPYEVLECSAIWWDGQCREIAICDLYIDIDIPGFEFLYG